MDRARASAERRENEGEPLFVVGPIRISLRSCITIAMIAVTALIALDLLGVA